MTDQLVIRMSIPIECREIVALPAVLFSRWLPSTIDDHIIVQRENFELAIWFDVSGLDFPPDEERLDRTPILLAERANIEVTVRGLEAELIDFVVRPPRTSDSGDARLKETLEQLGINIYKFIVLTLNRLITYLRVEKGQYWLKEHDQDTGLMGSELLQYNAEVSADRKSWRRWTPTDLQTMRVNMNPESSWIHREDWLKAGEYVKTQRSSNFVLDLLSTSRSNAYIGSRRAALLDAVTALEISISEFSQSPNARRAFGDIVSRRMDITSLKTQIDRLGNSSTIKYLFPVIFSENTMPTETLKICSDAIDERNNVIHNGQRDVSSKKIHKYIDAMDQVCRKLSELSVHSES